MGTQQSKAKKTFPLGYMLELPECKNQTFDRLADPDLLNLSQVNDHLKGLVIDYCKKKGRIFVLLKLSVCTKWKKGLVPTQIVEEPPLPNLEMYSDIVLKKLTPVVNFENKSLVENSPKEVVISKWTLPIRSQWLPKVEKDHYRYGT